MTRRSGPRLDARRLARSGAGAATGFRDRPPEGFIARDTNAEMRWDTATDLDYLVPGDRFFVRNHTTTPAIDPQTWRLSIYGDGLSGSPSPREPLSFSYHELRQMPSVDLTCAIECTGNGRGFFATQQGTPTTGTPWTLGAIGVARWRGVALGDLLQRAGLLSSAEEVMPVGLDAPYVDDGIDHGRVRRPLPIAKALDDVLVAYAMNGELLPPDSGFPARLVVPGWVGIASTKWLGSIEVSRQPLTSPWNTVFYRMTGGDYPTDSPPLTTLPVKSAFELAIGARLPARRPTVLHGRSWSGTARIRGVEVSADGGRHWTLARLLPPESPAAWTRWELAWTPPSPGVYELRARATDSAGVTQPDSVPYNSAGYHFWAVVRHPVTAVGG